MIEKIPFLHRGNTYHIIITDDISFKVLHYLLDCIIEKGAFEADEGFADKYSIEQDGQTYTICVDSNDVFIVIE